MGFYCTPRENIITKERTNERTDIHTTMNNFINSGVRCGMCLERLQPDQGRSWYIWACGHAYHAQCIWAEYTGYLYYCNQCAVTLRMDDSVSIDSDRRAYFPLDGTWLDMSMVNVHLPATRTWQQQCTDSVPETITPYMCVYCSLNLYFPIEECVAVFTRRGEWCLMHGDCALYHAKTHDHLSLPIHGTQNPVSYREFYYDFGPYCNVYNSSVWQRDELSFFGQEERQNTQTQMLDCDTSRLQTLEKKYPLILDMYARNYLNLEHKLLQVQQDKQRVEEERAQKRSQQNSLFGIFRGVAGAVYNSFVQGNGSYNENEELLRSRNPYEMVNSGGARAISAGTLELLGINHVMIRMNTGLRVSDLVDKGYRLEDLFRLRVTVDEIYQYAVPFRLIEEYLTQSTRIRSQLADIEDEEERAKEQRRALSKNLLVYKCVDVVTLYWLANKDTEILQSLSIRLGQAEVLQMYVPTLCDLNIYFQRSVNWSVTVDQWKTLLKMRYFHFPMLDYHKEDLCVQAVPEQYLYKLFPRLSSYYVFPSSTMEEATQYFDQLLDSTAPQDLFDPPVPPVNYASLPPDNSQSTINPQPKIFELTTPKPDPVPTPNPVAVHKVVRQQEPPRKRPITKPMQPPKPQPKPQPQPQPQPQQPIKNIRSVSNHHHGSVQAALPPSFLRAPMRKHPQPMRPQQKPPPQLRQQSRPQSQSQSQPQTQTHPMVQMQPVSRPRQKKPIRNQDVMGKYESQQKPMSFTEMYSFKPQDVPGASFPTRSLNALEQEQSQNPLFDSPFHMAASSSSNNRTNNNNNNYSL